MSKLLIQNYLAELSKLRQVGGTHRESVVREAFKDFDESIKWSETLKRRAKVGQRERFDARRIVHAAYRPFVSPYLYLSELLIDRPGLAATFFPPGKANNAICFSDAGSRADYVVLAVKGVADLHSARRSMPISR